MVVEGWFELVKFLTMVTSGWPRVDSSWFKLVKLLRAGFLTMVTSGWSRVALELVGFPWLSRRRTMANHGGWLNAELGNDGTVMTSRYDGRGLARG